MATQTCPLPIAHDLQASYFTEQCLFLVCVLSPCRYRDIRTRILSKIEQNLDIILRQAAGMSADGESEAWFKYGTTVSTCNNIHNQHHSRTAVLNIT